MLDTAVISTPSMITVTLVSDGIKTPMPPTSWNTLSFSGIQLTTFSTQPSLLADTDSRDTVTMSRAQGVRTILVLTELPLVAFHAVTLSILTVTMSATIRHFTFFISDIALFSFPTRLAQTFTISIISLSTTKQRTHTFKTKFEFEYFTLSCT